MPSEGISLDDSIRRVIDCEERNPKSFSVVSKIEENVDKVIHVTGSRQWNSRLMVLRKICEISNSVTKATPVGLYCCRWGL